jgi:hypothetical protein
MTGSTPERFLQNTVQFTKFRNLLIPSVIHHHEGCLELTSLSVPNSELTKIHQVTLEMKHMKGWTDTTASLCIHCMHFVQRIHETWFCPEKKALMGMLQNKVIRDIWT